MSTGFVLQCAAIVGWQFRTALHWACRNGHVEMVEFLVDKGADLSIPGYGGLTAVHFAVNSSFEEILKFLLDNSASASAVDHSGNSPLHW